MLYAPLTSEWLKERGSNKPFCDEHLNNGEKLEKEHSEMNVEDCLDLIH